MFPLSLSEYSELRSLLLNCPNFQTINIGGWSWSPGPDVPPSHEPGGRSARQWDSTAAPDTAEDGDMERAYMGSSYSLL